MCSLHVWDFVIYGIAFSISVTVTMSSSAAFVENSRPSTKGVLVRLTEVDIPGASLGGKRPEDVTVPGLKRWLACRGASHSGRKAELVER